MAQRFLLLFWCYLHHLGMGKLDKTSAVCRHGVVLQSAATDGHQLPREDKYKKLRAFDTP